jgi:hypothetical protein
MPNGFRETIETPAKWDFLRFLGQRFGFNTLIETGGFHGASMKYLQHDFTRLVTIELGRELFEDIYELKIPNLLCLRGDSSRVLRQFLMFFDAPALFWLDAHPSGGDTVGYSDAPIAQEELEAVLTRGNTLDVIVIDDVGYPSMEKDDFRAVVARYPGWRIGFDGDGQYCVGLVSHDSRGLEDN